VGDDARAVILFDGVCNVCAASVRFIAPRDPAGRFAFATLQSDSGRRLLAGAGLPADYLEGIVLIEGGRAYLKSDAVLRIASRLSGAWPLFGLLRMLPRALRDAAYTAFIARRYAWFGKSDACLVPSADLARRFLA
jgi:predicted DCC family thiol-disulfide oxidoreductase YuxK